MKAAEEVKHTPGPWYQGHVSGGQGLVISEQTGANIAVTYDSNDACLVAAAPELLEALKDLLWQFNDRISDPQDSELETVQQAEAAIRKAEGKE